MEGTITRRVEPGNEPGTEVVLGSLMVGAAPTARPLKVTSFGPEEALTRA
jgi:hypothetical protein